jgi:ketosteroid isomerase-like protein
LSFDYHAYLDCFLTGDDEALVAQFFAEDCEMRSSSGVRRGLAGMREFLNWAHDGVRECPRLQHYVQDANTVFADIDMDFHATKHRRDFPFGELHPGDSLTVKFFARYDLDEHGKVKVLTTAAWPPGVGVTALPLLGAHPSQIAAYHAYAAAFSNADPARFKRFYTEDVVLELGSVPRIEGADGIASFYTAMFSTVRETLTIHDLAASDERIVVYCTSRFTAVADAPDFVVAPLTKGEWVEVGVKVTYALREGRICHISVARTRDPLRSNA